MLAEQLGAADTPELRAELDRLRAFFNAKERVARFKAACEHPQTPADVQRGALAALLVPKGATGPATDIALIVQSYLAAAPDEPAAVLGKLRKYELDAVLAALVRRTCGYEGPLDDTRALACHLLLTAAAATMPADALTGLESHISQQHAVYCLNIVRGWMQASPQMRQALYDTCRMVEETCNLSERFSSLPLAALVGCDVFPAVNEALLSDLLGSIADGADRFSEAAEVVAARKDMKWYTHLSCYFDLLDAAARAGMFYKAHAGGFHEGTAAGAWRAYTNDWREMDAVYRAFTLAYQRCLQAAAEKLEDAARAAGAWMERLYCNWFLDGVGSCWVAAAESQWLEQGYVEGIARQRDFYDEELVAGIGPSKHAVVIVSDALRYEVARELGERLERETRGRVELSSMQGVFPSITEFGMAALLPHRALSFDAQANEVLADGIPTTGTAQRERVLQARNPKSRALRAAEYTALGKDERVALLKANSVVYLYHDKIDATGEKAATEADVFAACETALRDIVALAKRVTADVPSARVLVTADHGFLYTRDALEEHELVSAAGMDDASLSAGKRHALLVLPVGDDELFVRLGLTDISGGEYYGIAPRQAVRIKRRGGTRNYVHGGVSLQELVVPVVRFFAKRSGAPGAKAAEPARLQLLSPARRITNGLFGIELFQPEPVGGKVAPAEYELVFTDCAGNEISDRRRAVADRSSADERSRVSRLRFSLAAGRQFEHGEPCYLVARDKQGGSMAWKEEFTIEIAFAPLDEFGF